MSGAFFEPIQTCASSPMQSPGASHWSLPGLPHCDSAVAQSAASRALLLIVEGSSQRLDVLARQRCSLYTKAAVGLGFG